jgi:hypothetical protein
VIQRLILQEHLAPRGGATLAFNTPPGPSGTGSGQNEVSKQQRMQQVPAPEEEPQAATHSAQAVSQVRGASNYNQLSRAQKQRLERENMLKKVAGMLVTNRLEASAHISSHLPVFQKAITTYLHAVSTSYFCICYV